MEEEYEEDPEMIKVITKEPNREPEIREIPNDYRCLAEFCKGLIGMGTMPNDERANYIVNDSSLVNGMEPNIVLPEYEEVIAGPVMFAGLDPDTGNTVSLTGRQVERIMRYIERNQVFNMSMGMAYRYSKACASASGSEKEMEV